MTYDYDKAPTDPHHGGKLTAEMAQERIAILEELLRQAHDALRPFADAYRQSESYAGGMRLVDFLSPQDFARAAELVAE